MDLPWTTRNTPAMDPTMERSIDQIYFARETERLSHVSDPTSLLLDLSGPLTDGAQAVIDDSFWRCFEHNHPEERNWNFYLFPPWLVGVVIRWTVLLPLRILLLVLAWLLFIPLFTLASLGLFGPWARTVQTQLVWCMCNAYLASWGAAVRYHGPVPARTATAVWVANHTSMIDWAVLSAFTPFAVIMQIHGGWVGLVQKRILGSLGCIHFNRTEAKDREVVTERMQTHVADASLPPLLVFPEGTCVNNQYSVLFKRGAFDLVHPLTEEPVTVYPIAIKYNAAFVDAFWNSRRQSFAAHLFHLMTTWGIVADVHFLAPERKRVGETGIEFAQRVQRRIAARAQLHIVPWDGYLKYYSPNPKIVENRRRAFAKAAERIFPASWVKTSPS